MDKKCLLINSQFSWILKVDDEEISFQGRHNAYYFMNHYKSLGYEVEITDQYRLKGDMTS